MTQEKAGTWVNGEYYDTSPIKNFNVHDNHRTNTGVLDSKGRTIFKEPNEIGFGRRQNMYSVYG